jgi:hypothetical protein
MGKSLSGQFRASIAIDFSAECDFDNLWGFPRHVDLLLDACRCKRLEILPISDLHASTKL